MAYEPTIWKNRAVERPRTYTLQNNPDGTVTFVPAPGVIVESGTPVNAVNLNKLEQGLKTHEENDVQQTNEGQTEIPHGLPKCKYDATEPPTTNNDEAEGYSVGSRWVIPSTEYQQEFICTDSSLGQANWRALVQPKTLQLYDNGNEFIDVTGGWVEGYSEGNGSAIKESNFLNLKTFDNPTTPGSKMFETVNKVSLMNVNTLKIAWENQTVDGTCYLVVSNVENAAYNDFDARLYKDSAMHPFSTTINELDVSSLVGEYYIRVATREPNAPINNDLKVYKVWGEE